VAQRAVLLVDLESPYDTALAARCAGAAIRAIPVHGELPQIPTDMGLVLCVVAISGRGEDPVSRVRAVAKLVGRCPVVVLARDTGLDSAVRLIRFGVADVIETPAPAMEVAARAFNSISSGSQQNGREDFIGQSPAMARLRERIANASRVASTVLIQGETGTGKGVVARMIHEGSERRGRPFVHVDCGALAPSLIESELFGHERGAFTGAAVLRRGRFESAELGTVFLDEIGELSLQLQAKLLRVLEDREFERVGGSAPLRLHARVLAATNRDLQAGVRDGSFRPDLWFRLNVLSIEVPSLRERASDIPLLVHAGLRRICETHGVPAPHVSDAVLAKLAERRWPGNVRELLNLLERLAIEQRGAVSDPDELGAYLSAPEPLAPVTRREVTRSALDAEEQADAERIEEALVDSGGNLSRTARRLELPRSTLRHKIAKYRLGHLVPKD
jgi:DNA-binding NtrC family response regulator